MLGFKNILDWVFDRNDVLHALDIDEIDKRRKRRRLPLPHRAHYQKETLCFAREHQEALGQIEFLHSANLFWNEAHCNPDCAALEERVATETVAVVAVYSKIELLAFLKVLQLSVGDERLEKPKRILRPQDRLFEHGRQITVDANRGMRRGRKMQVGRAFVNDDVDIFF